MSSAAEPQIEMGGFSKLPEVLRAAGAERVFLICGSSGRYLERLRHTLDGLPLCIFSEARRHVPRELVERARAELALFGADAVVSVGGGSATGLGKALRLDHPFFFIALPTTYAGSELTDLYGITSAEGKRTGRDPRVVPDAVIYDVDASLDMPLALSVTSLLNAMAHPLSALSTGQLETERWDAAIVAARCVEQAVVGVLDSPRDAESRRLAFEGTVLAGRVLRRCPVGVHHRIAHALGGRFDLDHAGLHSLLLPHSVAWLARANPELSARLGGELGPGLAHRLLNYVRRSGAAASLPELGLKRTAFDEFLASQSDLPLELLSGAFSGILAEDVAREPRRP
jgi:maleylacetate reductase